MQAPRYTVAARDLEQWRNRLGFNHWNSSCGCGDTVRVPAIHWTPNALRFCCGAAAAQRRQQQTRVRWHARTSALLESNRITVTDRSPASHGRIDPDVGLVVLSRGAQDTRVLG